MAKKKSKSVAPVSSDVPERTYSPDPLTDLQPVVTDYDVLDDPEIVEHPAEFVGGSQSSRVSTIDDEATTDVDDRPTIKDIFGPGGLLKQCMPQGYEHRRSQLEMAQILEKAFQKRQHAIVEAGTGTGKTLAYLIPAICSGRRVVISTATKSLQEQLYQKDVPFLQKHFAPNLKVAVMKGRSNFLCHARVNQMASQPMLKGLEEIDAFRQIREWSKLTETGDRSE